MFKLSKNSKGPKVKIVKGKDGKKGLKINGKLVLPISYDDIRVIDSDVFMVRYGIFSIRKIEVFLTRGSW